MILFGLHLNKPYLLFFDSRSWNDESWEVQLMRSSCQSRRCIQCRDLIDPKCWGSFLTFFVGSLWKISNHCIEQIDTNCGVLSETEILMFFFFLIFGCGSGYIYIQWVNNCHFTVHVLYYFNFGGRDDYSCLVVELIQFWSDDSEDHKPSEPRINHKPQQGNPVASAYSSFLKDVLRNHALIGKVEWGDHWKTQVNEKNKKKSNGDPDDDHDHDHDDEEDDSSEFDASARLYACVKVQSAFSPRSTTRSTSRPTFFLVGLFNQQTTIGRVFCPVQFLWISSSANHCWWEKSGIFCQAVALSHLLDPCF